MLRRQTPPRRSNHADVRGRRALGAIRQLELHALVFLERLVSAHLDLAVVGEDILAAAVRGDEAEPLLVAEPFHDACDHFNCLSGCARTNPPAWDRRSRAG